jgi:hypothetical protein
MLLSITQIMRTDESHDLKFDSFDAQNDFFVEDHDGIIQNLALEFIGKADLTLIFQYVNADHLHPEFCPVRHLLLYVFLLQKLLGGVMPSGFLFMPPEYLRRRANGQSRGGLPRNGHFPEHIGMSSLRGSLKHLLGNVLDLAFDSMKIGLHMFRKTGYAFRLWAHGLMDKTAAMAHSAWAILKHDARHVNDADAMNYAQCAWSLVRLMTTFDDPRNRVSQTKSIRYMSSGRRGHVLNLSPIKGKSLNYVAERFVEQQLHEQSAQYINHYDLFQRLFDPQLVSSFQQERESFVSKLPPELLAHFRRFETAHHQHQIRLRRGLDQANPEHGVEDPHDAVTDVTQNQQGPGTHVQPPPGPDAPAQPPVPDDHALPPVPNVQVPPAAPPAPPVRRVLGTNNLDIRLAFTNDKLVSDLVTHMHRVGEVKRQLTANELNGAAKKWLSTAFNPAMRCLERHHRGDFGAFAEHWADTKWNNNFSKKICCGNADVPCGTLL